MTIKIINKNKNFFNNKYEYLSVIQEEALSDIGLPKPTIDTLDRLLWVVLTGDLVSRHITVYEAVELATTLEEYKKLPILDLLKNSLKLELGIVC
jgi:hypothetical protein